MKRATLYSFFLIISLQGFSQLSHLTFDNDTNLFRIKIDTINGDNIWQIGRPEKSIFNSAHSIPNAIITDTLNPYPPNNNAIFYLLTGGDNFSPDREGHWAELDFWYKMDCDSLHDFGKIEISIDSGFSYHNIANWDSHSRYTVYNDSNKLLFQNSNGDTVGDTVVFTGKTEGWYHFISYVALNLVGYDTIFYRFSFRSDNVFDNREGWMLDDIDFGTGIVSIVEHNESLLIFPNPASNRIFIRSTEKITSITLYDLFGKIVFNREHNNSPSVDVSSLIPGIYIIKCISINNKVLIKKLIINRLINN